MCRGRGFANTAYECCYSLNFQLTNIVINIIYRGKADKQQTEDKDY